jgi:HNH endonuclease
VVTDGASQPLDVGRRTKVVPPPLRRAVTVRDGECRFPGCDRPPGWCDAHHVQHWADGGPTALENLVLLCRRHHRLIHRGFRVEMVDGVPVFSRPDGIGLDDRAPPLGLTA